MQALALLLGEVLAFLRLPVGASRGARNFPGRTRQVAILRFADVQEIGAEGGIAADVRDQPGTGLDELRRVHERD